MDTNRIEGLVTGAGQVSAPVRLELSKQSGSRVVQKPGRRWKIAESTANVDARTAVMPPRPNEYCAISTEAREELDNGGELRPWAD